MYLNSMTASTTECEGELLATTSSSRCLANNGEGLGSSED